MENEATEERRKELKRLLKEIKERQLSTVKTIQKQKTVYSEDITK